MTLFNRYLLPISLVVFLLSPIFSLALELDYPEIMGIDLNELWEESQRAGKPFPINQLIAWGYYFIITVSGLAAFFMLVVGGFKYLTSAGNPTAMAEGKERMVYAILGLLIVLTSYLFLKVINPELIMLKLPTL